MLTYRRADDLDEYNQLPVSPSINISDGILHTKQNPVIDDMSLQATICDVMLQVKWISEYMQKHNTETHNYYNEQYIIEYQDFLNKKSTEFFEYKQ